MKSQIELYFNGVKIDFICSKNSYVWTDLSLFVFDFIYFWFWCFRSSSQWPWRRQPWPLCSSWCRRVRSPCPGQTACNLRTVLDYRIHCSHSPKLYPHEDPKRTCIHLLKTRKKNLWKKYLSVKVTKTLTQTFVLVLHRDFFFLLIVLIVVSDYNYRSLIKCIQINEWL